MHGTDATLHLGRHLRLNDNPLLIEAAATSDRLLPVFSFDPPVPRGRHQEAFLLASRADWQASLRGLGSDLLVVHEPPPADVRDCYLSPLRMIEPSQLPDEVSRLPRTYTPFRRWVEASTCCDTVPGRPSRWSGSP